MWLPKLFEAILSTMNEALKAIGVIRLLDIPTVECRRF
jgi:hypothetical protein